MSRAERFIRASRGVIYSLRRHPVGLGTPARELLLTCPGARLHRREDHDHAVDRHTGAAGRRRIPDVAVQSWVGLLSEWIAGRRPDRDAPARAERPPLARSALVRNTHIEE